MRVGKFVEHFRAAAIASDAPSLDPVLRYTTVGRQLGYAMYMVLDNVTVVSIHIQPFFYRCGYMSCKQEVGGSEERCDVHSKQANPPPA
jgi:hypothetical protein